MQETDIAVSHFILSHGAEGEMELKSKILLPTLCFPPAIIAVSWHWCRRPWPHHPAWGKWEQQMHPVGIFCFGCQHQNWQCSTCFCFLSAQGDKMHRKQEIARNQGSCWAVLSGAPGSAWAPCTATVCLEFLQNFFVFWIHHCCKHVAAPTAEKLSSSF